MRAPVAESAAELEVVENREALPSRRDVHGFNGVSGMSAGVQRQGCRAIQAAVGGGARARAVDSDAEGGTGAAGKERVEFGLQGPRIRAHVASNTSPHNASVRCRIERP